MEKATDLISVFTKLPFEYVSALVALGALALAAFAIYVVFTIAKDKK